MSAATEYAYSDSQRNKGKKKAEKFLYYSLGFLKGFPGSLSCHLRLSCGWWRSCYAYHIAKPMTIP